MTTTVQHLPFELPLSSQASTSKQSFGKLSPLVKRKVEPVGPAYRAHARRVLQGFSFEQDDKIKAEEDERNGLNNIDEEDGDDVPEEEESNALLALDPKEWKKQDHYAVLGLSSLRYKATPEQIKKAHRKKVLKHHPDKKAKLAGHNANDDSFFKCIAKAYDTLSVPEKRRIFDSADEAIDQDDTPPRNLPASEFFTAWAPVFEREGRFSKKQPVARLGDASSSKPEVEDFYDFWYNFDSWRSFEYYDKEVNEGTDSRDEKRHAERKNKSERAKRKKEDVARVRMLVDDAMAADPRLKAFKQKEKAARDAKKKGPGGKTAAQIEQEAADKKAAEEAEAKAKADAEKQAAEAKVGAAANKKAKEAARKNLKKDQKAIAEVVKSSNYFLPAGQAPEPAKVEAQLNELDVITKALEPEQVSAFRKELDGKKADSAAAKSIVISWAATSKASGLSEFAS
ncbi:uncharacterized protein L969DRAFT_44900 [Mixia osmundae IAM 14324]|uniref:J domain-containing protein n=1 Tax=Mixia osmundae (strain CBS 9802 / IAM 14324 / JCM 22182 / KY 12970) TaxID=764103 RepID=G7DYB6_MIXOS|nr:uncharacterized protein L969DRAFT_44900 [Mixia osmundae IAM 14324]KEI41478.1 hypothetical protein L969DRAFT_44900 [Mixia osmundae IAM 14324]GAA95576.1 hypothetical protein E5Q_02231 [Mixia osmundae IAM 14324]